jgi:hypothetical protein
MTEAIDQKDMMANRSLRKTRGRLLRRNFDITVLGNPDQISSGVTLRNDSNTNILTTGDRYVKLVFHQRGFRSQVRNSDQGAEVAVASGAGDLHPVRS